MSSVKAVIFIITLFVLVTVVYFGRNYLSRVEMEDKTVEENDAIQDGFINVHLQNRQEVLRIFYREVNPMDDEIETGVESIDKDDKPVKIDVLLLHGRKFSSKTWFNLKTISILGRNGHRTVAVDLPGYGNSEGHASLEGEDEKQQLARSAFLKELIEVLGLIHPAIVSPSMSGSYSLPLLMNQPNVIGAYIPVAPIHTEKFPPEFYMRTKVPTLIVYGSLDKSLGLVSLHNLRYLPIHEVLVLPNASHPAYLDQPNMWHERLKLFLNAQKLVS